MSPPGMYYTDISKGKEGMCHLSMCRQLHIKYLCGLLLKSHTSDTDRLNLPIFQHVNTFPYFKFLLSGKFPPLSI